MSASTEIRVGGAQTSSGADLPLVALPQSRLLTVNVAKLPLLNNVLAEGVHVKVLRADVEQGEWVIIATFEPGARVPLHYHTGCVDGYTMSGSWYYVEYPEDLQVADSYLYEPGGSVHTLAVPESNTEDTVVYFRIHGANVNFNEDGSYHSILDAATVQHVAETAAQAQGSDFEYLGGGAVRYMDAVRKD